MSKQEGFNRAILLKEILEMLCSRELLFYPNPAETTGIYAGLYIASSATADRYLQSQ